MFQEALSIVYRRFSDGCEVVHCILDFYNVRWFCKHCSRFCPSLLAPSSVPTHLTRRRLQRWRGAMRPEFESSYRAATTRFTPTCWCSGWGVTPTRRLGMVCIPSYACKTQAGWRTRIFYPRTLKCCWQKLGTQLNTLAQLHADKVILVTLELIGMLCLLGMFFLRCLDAQAESFGDSVRKPLQEILPRLDEQRKMVTALTWRNLSVTLSIVVPPSLLLFICPSVLSYLSVCGFLYHQSACTSVMPSFVFLFLVVSSKQENFSWRLKWKSPPRSLMRWGWISYQGSCLILFTFASFCDADQAQVFSRWRPVRQFDEGERQRGNCLYTSQGQNNNLQVCVVERKFLILNHLFLQGIKPLFISLINKKLLTFNRHSTQCHWPDTLEWGCSVGPCTLADSLLYKIFFPQSQPDTKRKSPTLLYQELHSLFTNIPCFPPKPNAVSFKMLPWRKVSKVSSFL